MSKKTFRTVITISLLGCLLYYTMSTVQRFQIKIDNLKINIENERQNFYCTVDRINGIYKND